jgi:hypothetical protein
MSDERHPTAFISPGETSNATAEGSKAAAIDLRIAAARANLSQRLGELERRVDEVKHNLDPASWLANPWARVGIAAAVGFVLGRSEAMQPILRAAFGTAINTLVHQAIARAEHQ